MSSSRLQEWLGIGANIAIVMTLGMGLASFWYQYDRNKATHTIDLADRIFQEPLAASERRFVSEINKLPLEQLADQQLPREFIAELTAQVVREADDPIVLRDDIIALTHHYDRLQTCIENRLCKPELLRAQIDPAATRFACWVMPYVRNERKRMLLTGLGDGFATLIDYENNC